MSIDVNVQNDLVIVTESSEDITVNVSNAAGPAGVGVPVGGTTGQVLKKQSGTDYDTFWALDGVGVPYSGATGNVDLGDNDLEAGSVFVEGAAGAGGALRIKQFGSSAANLDGYSTISTLSTGVFYFTAATTSPNFKNFVLNPSGITDNILRTYTLPNLDGTLALLSDIPSLTGFVPYTGATTNVDLGTHRILAQNATIASSGSGDTFTLNHSSGSGIGLNITKGGSGEGLYVNKTSGSGNAATIIGTLNATTLVKSGGTSSQFLKADGSVDSTTYVGGSGVTGQVSYWNGTNSQTGSNNLFWDAANARLGIGTNAPASLYKLDVVGAIRASTFLWSPAFYAPSDLFFGISGGTSAMRITTNRNVQIFDGSTPADGGQRLQVQGDAFIKGSGATSATTALLVQNSAGNQLAQFRNDQFIQIGNTASTLNLSTFINFGSVQLYPINNGNYAVAANATELRFDTTFSGVTTGDFGYLFGTYSAHNTSNANPKSVVIFGSFSPTSGTQTFTNTLLNPTINQTGGANGITRGLYVNPTLTAAADWRSIEWSNSTGWGLYGAGSAPNYLGGTLTASSFIKSGGTSAQILAADGSVITAGTNITISGGTISASGGGGGTTIYTGDGTLTSARTVTSGGFPLTFTGSNTAASAIARGLNLTHTLVAAANNDVLVGLDVNPTFTNGAFTGADNVGLRVTAGRVSINTNRTLTFAPTVDIISNNALFSSKPNHGGVWISQLNNTNNANLTFFNNVSTLFQIGVTGSAFGSGMNSKSFILSQSDLFFTTNASAGNPASSDAKMVLTLAGRLLLGTTTESTFILDAVGTARITGDALVNGLTVGKGAGSLTLNTALGFQALNANTTGNNNTAIGYAALQKNTSGGSNTAIGVGSSLNITTGSLNTSVGVNSCGNITTGNNNTGIGHSAILLNTTGTDNTAIGLSALSSNLTGQGNTSIGVSSSGNLLGNFNTAIGLQALRGSVSSTGSNNIGIGRISLFTNTTGESNVAIGNISMADNNTGSENSALGGESLSKNISGSQNVAVGRFAGNKITGGATDNSITNNSIYIGYNTKALANNQTNQIIIGHNETGLGSNTTIIGNSSTTLTALRGSLISGGTSTNASAQLQVDSTTKGFLPPRMTNAQRTAIGSPAVGLIVYCTDAVEGLYVYKSTGWTFVI